MKVYTGIERHQILCPTRDIRCTLKDCLLCQWNKYEPLLDNVCNKCDGYHDLMGKCPCVDTKAITP